MNNHLSYYRKPFGHCLAVVSLMALMVVPFLMNHRVGPQGGFVIESTSVILALLLVLGVGMMGHLCYRPPVVSVMFVGFAAFIVLQARLMHLSWLSQVDLTATVCLVAALAAWALASWQRSSKQALMYWLAWGLVLGVLLQTAVMWLQYWGYTKLFHGMVSYSSPTSIMGQLGQRNHLGHYLMWGMVSVLYLKHTHAISRWLAVALVFWLGLSMGLIGSRTLIVYLIAISVLAVVWRVWAGRAWQATLVWAIAALVWVLLAQFGLDKLLGLLHQTGTTTGLERLVNATHIVDNARNVEWQKAWMSFTNSPVVGHGWGSSASQSMVLHQALPNLEGLRTVGVLFTHCHNLVLQLLSEVGVVGMVWLLGCVLAMVWACFRHAQRPEGFFVLALITVSLCHSLLEYPLWYVYFLLPFALFWALVPRGEVFGQVKSIGRHVNMAASILALVGIAQCVRLLFAYNDIVQVYGVAKNESPAVAAEKKAKIHQLIEREYLLDYYARMALIERSFDAYQGSEVADEIENARLVAEYRPYASYAVRWGMYQYRTGQRDAGKAWLDQTWRYYPNNLPSGINAMQKSLWYTDLLPLAQQRCAEYKQRIDIKCP